MVRFDTQIIAARRKHPREELEIHQLVVLVVVADFGGIFALGVFGQVRALRACLFAVNFHRAGDVAVQKIELKEDQSRLRLLVFKRQPLPAVLAFVGVVKVFDVVGGPEHRLPESHRRGVFPVARGVGNDFRIIARADAQRPERNAESHGLTARRIRRRKGQRGRAGPGGADNEIAAWVAGVKPFRNCRVPGRIKLHLDTRLRRINFFFDDVEGDGGCDLRRYERVRRRKFGG